MRPVVAIVEARPESIAQDYARALSLAGLSGPQGPCSPAARRRGVVVAATVCGRRALPGFSSPPWQLDGVLGALAQGPEAGDAALPPAEEDRAQTLIPVVPVDVRGGRGRPASASLQAVLARHGAQWMPPGALTGLRRHSLVLLPVPVLIAGLGAAGSPAADAGLTVRGAVDMLERVLAPAAPGRRRGAGPLSPPVLAAAARPLLPDLAVVMDAVLWGAGLGTLRQGPIQRNLVLAGADPVAVDAVATRLAGRDPLRAGRLRQCQEAGLGVCDLQAVRLVGHVELLAEAFDGARHAGRVGRGPWSMAAAGAAAWALLRRRALLRGHRDTPWGRLAAAYAAQRTGGRP